MELIPTLVVIGLVVLVGTIFIVPLPIVTYPFCEHRTISGVVTIVRLKRFGVVEVGLMRRLRNGKTLDLAERSKYYKDNTATDFVHFSTIATELPKLHEYVEVTVERRFPLLSFRVFNWVLSYTRLDEMTAGKMLALRN